MGFRRGAVIWGECWEVRSPRPALASQGISIVWSSPAGPACGSALGYQASSVCEWKSITASRLPRRSITDSTLAKGPVTAR